MAPSLRPLPPPSSRHRSINPERASRRKVNSYREAGSDSDDDDIFVLDDPDDADFAPGYPLNGAANGPYGYVSPKKRTRRPEATITRDWEGHTSSDNTSTSPYNNNNNSADLLSSSTHQINFVPELPPKITRSSPQHAKSSLFRKTRNKTAKIASSALSSPKKRKRANIAAYDPNADPINLAHVPPWQALPYHVLREVFSYAWEMTSHRPSTHHPHNVKWMLGVSRLCRSFFDAAIGVIWSSPPLYPITKLNRLHTLLASPQTELATNYRNKIRELEVHWPHYTAQKWQLVELVSHMPQLRRLSFVEYAQEAPGRTAQFLEWEKLFDAMDANEVRLRSWDWNAGVMRIPENVSLDALQVFHQRPMFSSLQTLRFVNFSEDLMWTAEEYTNDTAEYDGEMPTLGWQLTQAIKALPTLQHLEFSRCSVVDERVLLNLPNTLQSLTLDGCKYLTSQTLSLFLASHGMSLKELTITHNPSLTLSFTTHLASLCPSLEILKFGFNADFHDEASLDDNDILLLSQTADEVPTWPSTLQHLEIDRPGRWSEESAVRIFNSLLDSARDLPDLRVLIVNVILMLEWRSRASFRKKWEAKFEKAFKRRAEPPNPLWNSLASASASNSASASASVPADVAHPAAAASPAKQPTAPQHSTNPRPRRQIARVSSYRDGSSDDDDDDDEEPPAASDWTDQTAAAAVETSADEAEVPYVQGMCDVVRIRMDNMRPTDVLRTADEFVDTESSGDEDWNGQDSYVDEDYAW